MTPLSQEDGDLRLELPDTPSLASPLRPSLLWRPWPLTLGPPTQHLWQGRCPFVLFVPDT